MGAAGLGPARQYRGMKAKLLTAFACCFSLYMILYVANVFELFGIYILSEPHRGVCLAVLLALVFLHYPATKSASKDGLPWYDALFCILGAAGPLYYVLVYWSLAGRLEYGEFYTFEIVLFFVTMALVLEASRRVLGIALPMVAVLFLSHNFFCNYFPGVLHGRGYSIERVLSEVAFGAVGLMGMPIGVAATIIIMFLLFAQFMLNLGAGETFNKLAFALLGDRRGGPAKGAVLASSAMATVSGGTMTNVAVTGVFTIPLMKKVGYNPEFAGAVEAVASNGGLLTPPVMSSVAFIMAEWLEMPYIYVCIAAALPAVLYYIAVFMIVDWEAARNKLLGLPRETLPSAKEAIKQGWYYTLPLIAMVYILAVLLYSPGKAALGGLAVLLIVAIFTERSLFSPRKLIDTLSGGVIAWIPAAIACAASGIIIGSSMLTGLGVKLSGAIVDFSGGSLMIVLLLTAISSFILGMGLHALPCYMMLAVLVAPALVKMGVLPIAAHLFVFYFGTVSFITPPVALSAYIAASIAGGNPIKTGIQAVRLGIATFIIPFMFVYNRALLMKGSLGEIVLTSVSSVIGVLLLASGAAGYLLKREKWWERLLLIGAAIMLLVPGWVTDIAGIGLGAAVLLRQRRALLLVRLRERDAGY